MGIEGEGDSVGVDDVPFGRAKSVGKAGMSALMRVA